MSAHTEDSLSHDLTLVFSRLLTQAHNDATLATALRRLADRIQEVLGRETSTVNDEPTHPAVKAPLASQLRSPEEDIKPASTAKLHCLVAAWSSSDSQAITDRNRSGDHSPDMIRFMNCQEHELIDICRIKARAASWQARSMANEDTPHHDREQLIQQAGELGVFLWTVKPGWDSNLCSDIGSFQRLANTYEVCAMALEAWTQLPIARAQEVLTLVAEAQSMIRTAAAQAGYSRREDTAEAVHGWLCQVAAEVQVYIPRFMRPGDTADPEFVESLRNRVAQLTGTPRSQQPPPARLENPQVVEDEDAEDNQPPTPEVASVKELLRGKTVALFCGDRRPEKHRQLIEAFELQDLLWEDTPNKYSNGDHERVFNRPGLHLVILAKGWLSHSHTYTLPKLAAERGIPVVRLPGGYGVNRVAHEILEQASEKLARLD